MSAEVTDNSEAYLVMSNQIYIHQLSLDGSKVQTIISQGLPDTRAIDFDYRYLLRYTIIWLRTPEWADPETLVCTPLRLSSS